LVKPYETIRAELGFVRIEWAFDGGDIWILQVQQEIARSCGTCIVDGQVEREIDFPVELGLEKLRELVKSVRGTQTGIRLLGRVGMTSHIADV
jgi:hypothetical protein